MTRASGPAVVSPGEFASWTATVEVTACQLVTGLSAQGGRVAWATTLAVTNDGEITVRNLNKNNAVLLWEIGSMQAGQVATATLAVSGTVGRKAACGSAVPIASEWSTTADAGAGPIKYDTAGPLTVLVGC